MEDGSGLIVLDTPDDGTVDNHLQREQGAQWQGGGRTEGQRDRGSLHLLVWLHLAANNSEGVSSGVVVDLDTAEGLGTGASREPSLVAVIIKHHSGPAGTDDRLAARGESTAASHIFLRSI